MIYIIAILFVCGLIFYLTNRKSHSTSDISTVEAQKVQENSFDEFFKLSDELEKIGYFDLIEDNEKKKCIKEKIDFEYKNDDNPYIGKEWLILPNDYYISSVYNLEEYGNGSSTSDFRAFEVWGSSLFRGEFVEYLKSAKIVFEKNGLNLEWRDEIFDENTKDKIHHRITVNEKEYIIYSGKVENRGRAMSDYVYTFKNILNDAISRQDSRHKIILLTQPEHVEFILLDLDMLIKFKEIIKKTKNIIEE